MKFSIQIIATLFIAFTISSCGSSQEKTTTMDSYTLTTETPFTIIEAYSQEWVAGVQGGGSGTNIFLKFDKIDGDITIKDFYFQGNIAPLKALSVNSIAYQASFKGAINNDLIMDSDARKEAVNTPPVKIPFDLKDKEAVISYVENNTLKFFKISALPEKPLIAYPSANPNNKQ